MNPPFLRSASLGCFATLAAMLLGRPGSAAETGFSHAGDNDPINEEGWQTPDSDPSVSVGPIDDAGVAAWFVDDNSGASGSRRTYIRTPAAAQVEAASAQGWVLRLDLRLPNLGDAPDFAVQAEYSTGVTRYLLHFGTEADGDPIVVVGSADSYTLQGAGSTYHRYELIYSAAAGSASLYVDGELTPLTGHTGIPANGVPARVTWGSNHSSGTGQGNYSRVEWQIATDTDADGVVDAIDNCRYVQNNPNLDGGGSGAGSAADGIGDVCQCGALLGRGAVEADDLARYREYLVDPVGAALTTAEASRCAVHGSATDCDLLGVVVIARALAGLGPGLLQVCSAATGFGALCGDGQCRSDQGCRADGCQEDCGRCVLDAPCSLNADCASGICQAGVCAAPPPSVPGCGDGSCNGTESCSRQGPHGCYDDCGPCEPDADPTDGVPADYCNDDSECRSGTICLDAGKCQISGNLCADDSDCAAPGDTCDHAAFGTNIYEGFAGICSDFRTGCDTGFGGGYWPFKNQDTCDPGDYCRRRRICHGPLGEGCEIPPCCGAPPQFARACPDWESCGQDADCQSGVCYQAVYIVPGLAEETVSMCTPGAVPNGLPCLQSHDCQSGICNLGYCVASAWPNGTPCTTDAACQSGNCRNLICSADDCGDGVCDSLESCSPPTTQYPNPIQQCQADCGKCPNGHSCVSDSDCRSGNCNLVLGCQRDCDNGICEGGEACSTSFVDLSQTCTADCGRCGNGYTCGADTDCLSGHCEAGYCAPQPLTCRDLGNCPNGSICTQSSDCASNRCIGPPLGSTRYCIQQDCIAPGSWCGPGSSGSCCDFPGVNLSCTGFPTYYCNP